MAKITGPLLSITAHGSLAKAICFRRSPQGTTARNMTGIQLIPGHGTGVRPTAAQKAQRSYFADVRDAWRHLAGPDKDAAKLAASSASLPPFAYWFSKFHNLPQPYWVDILAPWDDGSAIWED